ncbi:hypothetical protein TNCV_1463601 [Trichonephila clavipes]|nr:hypothetical protein TNCV_1463601 [Trichonephila clavipes]
MIWINPDQRKLQHSVEREHGRTNKNIQSIREWRQFVEESLQVLNDINIDRCIVVEQPEVIRSTHGGLQARPGAVSIWSTVDPAANPQPRDGKIACTVLLPSKSRVAPTKQNSNDSQA